MGRVKCDALHDVSLKIREGEFMVIVGPSGSGKSTLLHILGCLDKPTHGKVLLGGVDVARLSEDETARVRGRKIGFVFQFFFLMSGLNAVENVELPMLFNGMTAEERRDRAIDLLKKVGLGDRLWHTPSQLSGGQRQRVAVARALANNPLILLADEPTGNLDSKSGNEILRLFGELHKKEGRTIIVVTHDTGLIHHAERVVRLKDGVIESDEKMV
ncbi:MAG: ABC transporter ATP-binding protein [Candidatus Micrarchaeota archaeon]